MYQPLSIIALHGVFINFKMSCARDICHALLLLIAVGLGLMLKTESYTELYTLKTVDRSHVFCSNRDV